MKDTLITLGICLVLTVALTFTTIVIVPAGHTGVAVKMGAVQDDVLQEGIHVKMPFAVKIKTIDNRVVRSDVDCTSASKDLQTVSATVAVNYRVDPKQSSTIYKNVGNKYEDVIVRPAVQESVNAIAAQYTAEELITQRQVVGEKMKDSLTDKISPYGLSVEVFNVINFSFRKNLIGQLQA